MGRRSQSSTMGRSHLQRLEMCRNREDDERKEDANDEYQSVEQRCHALFIDTNLDTHLIVELSDVDTVIGIKRKIVFEHPKCHPKFGEIKIDSLMVERRGYHYHLSDSMLVKQAFSGVADNWFIFANISSRVRHSETLDLRDNFIGEGPLKMLLDHHDSSSLQLVINRHKDQRVLRMGSLERKMGGNKKSEVSEALGPKSVVAHVSRASFPPESIPSMPKRRRMHNMAKKNFVANPLDLAGTCFDASRPQENKLKEADYDWLIRHSPDRKEGFDHVDGLPQNYYAGDVQSRRVNKKSRVENDNVVEDPVLGNQPLVCNYNTEMCGLQARVQKSDLGEGSVHLGTPIESLAVNFEEALEENLVTDVSEGDGNRVLNSHSVENEMKTTVIASSSRVKRLRRTKKNSTFAGNFLLLMEESDNVKKIDEHSKNGNILADIYHGISGNTAYAEQERSFSNNKDPEVVMSEYELTSDRNKDNRIKPRDSAGVQQKTGLTNKFSVFETQHLTPEATICDGHVNDETKNTSQHVEPALVPRFVRGEGRSAKLKKKTRKKQAIAEINFGAVPFKELHSYDKNLLPADDKTESNLEARNAGDAELESSDKMKYELVHSDYGNITQHNHHMEYERVANVEQKEGHDNEAMESKHEQCATDHLQKEDREIKSRIFPTQKQKTREFKNSAVLKVAHVTGMTDGVSVQCFSDAVAGVNQNDMGSLASTQLPRAEENTTESVKPNKKSKRKQTVEESNLSGVPMKYQDIGVRDLSVEGKMDVVGDNKTNSKAKSARSKLETRTDKDVVHESSHPMKTSVELSKNVDVVLDNYQMEPESIDNPEEWIDLSKNIDPEVMVSEHGFLTSERKKDKEFKSGSSAGKKKKTRKEKNSAAPKTKCLPKMITNISVDKFVETGQEKLEPVSLTELQGDVEEWSEKPKNRTKRKQAIVGRKNSALPVKKQDSSVRDPSADDKIKEDSDHKTEDMGKSVAPDMVARSDKDGRCGLSDGTTCYAEPSQNEDVLDSCDNEPGNHGSAEQQLELQKKNDPEVMMPEEGLLISERKEDEEVKSRRYSGKKLKTREFKKSAAVKTKPLADVAAEMLVDEAAETSQKKLEPVSLTQLQDNDNVKQKSERPKKKTKRRQATADCKVSVLSMKEQDNEVRDSSVDGKIKEVSFHNTEGMTKSAAPDLEVRSDKDGGRELSHDTTSYMGISKNDDVVLDTGYEEPGNYVSAEQQLELQKKNDSEIVMSEERVLTSDRKEDEEIKSGRSARKRQKGREVENSAAFKTKHLTQMSVDVLVDEVDHPTQKNMESESSTQLLTTEVNTEEWSEKPKKKSKRKKTIAETNLSGFLVTEQESRIIHPSLNEKIKESGHETKVKANLAASKLEAESDNNAFAPSNSIEAHFWEATLKVQVSTGETNQVDQREVLIDEINQVNQNNSSTVLTNQMNFNDVRSNDCHEIAAAGDPADLTKVKKLDDWHEGQEKSNDLKHPSSISNSSTVKKLTKSNKSGGAEGHCQGTNVIGAEMCLGQLTSIDDESTNVQNIAKMGSSIGNERNTEGGSGTQLQNSVTKNAKVSSEDGEQLHGMTKGIIVPWKTNASKDRTARVNAHDEHEAFMNSSARSDVTTTHKKQGWRTKLEQRQQMHCKPTNSTTEAAAVPQKINGPKKKGIPLASMVDENETSMTSNGSLGMQGVRENANGQKLEFKHHQVGSRNSPYKQKEDVGGGLLQKNSVLASSGAIFMDESGSSEDEIGYCSDSGTRTPSDSSSTSYSGETGANWMIPQNGFPNADESTLKKSQSRSPMHVPLESMLRSSSRYKKAKLAAASQLQPDDTESPAVDFVPDSQTNV